MSMKIQGPEAKFYIKPRKCPVLTLGLKSNRMASKDEYRSNIKMSMKIQGPEAKFYINMPMPYSAMDSKSHINLVNVLY